MDGFIDSKSLFPYLEEEGGGCGEELVEYVKGALSDWVVGGA